MTKESRPRPGLSFFVVDAAALASAPVDAERTLPDSVKKIMASFKNIVRMHDH